MAKCRFLFDNKITDDALIVVSSQKNGIVTQAMKDGTGSATLTTSGNYTGGKDLEYIVEIDGVGAGAEIGQATFKWSDGGGSWDASGIATSSLATALNNGVSIAFVAGTGADFVMGDKWYFKAVNFFSPYKMIDNDRDTRYRSAGLSSPNTHVFDLTSIKTVNAIAIYDHNFTSGATILLEANSSDSWGAPAFSESITYNADKILQYLVSSQTYRYWRLSVTDTANSDGYIEIGNMGLYEYTELSKTITPDPDIPMDIIVQSNTNQYGVSRSRFYNYQESLDIAFNYLSDADFVKVKAMLNTIGTRADGIMRPIYFNTDSADVTEFIFSELMSMGHKIPFKGTRNGITGFHNIMMSLKEKVRSV